METELWIALVDDLSTSLIRTSVSRLNNTGLLLSKVGSGERIIERQRSYLFPPLESYHCTRPRFIYHRQVYQATSKLGGRCDVQATPDA